GEQHAEPGGDEHHHADLGPAELDVVCQARGQRQRGDFGPGDDLGAQINLAFHARAASSAAEENTPNPTSTCNDRSAASPTVMPVKRMSGASVRSSASTPRITCTETVASSAKALPRSAAAPSPPANVRTAVQTTRITTANARIGCRRRATGSSRCRSNPPNA